MTKTSSSARQRGKSQEKKDAAKIKVPPAQPGDKPDEVSKPAAQPVLGSVAEGKKHLDDHPARTSVLTKEGHLVRE